MQRSASSFRKMVSPCFSSPSICAIVPAWKTPMFTWSEYALSCPNLVTWGCSASQTSSFPTWSCSLLENPSHLIPQASNLNFSENVLYRNTKSRPFRRDFLLKASFFCCDNPSQYIVFQFRITYWDVFNMSKIRFESKSQQVSRGLSEKEDVFNMSKIRFESKSQRPERRGYPAGRCFQYVKDTLWKQITTTIVEGSSIPLMFSICQRYALKANHNN